MGAVELVQALLWGTACWLLWIKMHKIELRVHALHESLSQVPRAVVQEIAAPGHADQEQRAVRAANATATFVRLAPEQESSQ